MQLKQQTCKDDVVSFQKPQGHLNLQIGGNLDRDLGSFTEYYIGEKKSTYKYDFWGLVIERSSRNIDTKSRWNLTGQHMEGSSCGEGTDQGFREVYSHKATSTYTHQNLNCIKKNNFMKFVMAVFIQYSFISFVFSAFFLLLLLLDFILFKYFWFFFLLRFIIPSRYHNLLFFFSSSFSFFAS